MQKSTKRRIAKPKKTAMKKASVNQKVIKIEIGPPRLTRFERSRVIGARSLQLSLGAPSFIKIPANTYDPITIALLELESSALPISIKRRHPNGKYQNIPLSDLIELGKKK